MLTIIVPGEEVFDEATELFSTHGDVVLELEHSLVSLSKWESKFEKPFLDSINKSPEELFSYIVMMLRTPNVDPNVLSKLSEENVADINNYINAKMTATFIADEPPTRGNREVVTAELIYYWIVTFKINWEVQHWHLNRLFTLIRVCSIKQGKSKKRSPQEIAARNRKLNEERKKRLKTNG